MRRHNSNCYSEANRKARRNAKEKRDERLAMLMVALAVPVIYLLFYLI